MRSTDASGPGHDAAAARVSPGGIAGTAGWRLRRTLELRRDLVLGPLAGAIVLALLAIPGDPLRTAALSFAALAAGAGLARRIAPQAALMPLMRAVFPLVGPAIGVAALAGLRLLTGMPPAGPLDLLAALGASAFVAHPWGLSKGAATPGSLRTAFIGSASSAARLARAIDAAGSSQYSLVGRVAVDPHGAATDQDVAEPPALGGLAHLGALVVDHEVDVLVVGPDAPRLAVFEHVADSCLELPVRLVELSSLYEEVFGHVPTAEIDATWFECIADPHVRVSTAPLKRVIDIAGSIVLLAVALPVLVPCGLLIRRDGGPSLFRQVRIGEGGRRFCLYKLRSMRPGTGEAAQWAEPEDPRVTRIGTFLRRTHLDELPQLYNVLRGDMSLVGPRPEQPEFVDRLEGMLPFYQRRHLMRPGITGWAQVRCGYAGSDVGSAWKLCHDLYYVKHRSVGLDLLIMGETLATLGFAREPVIGPETVAFVRSDRA